MAAVSQMAVFWGQEEGISNLFFVFSKVFWALQGLTALTVSSLAVSVLLTPRVSANPQPQR